MNFKLKIWRQKNVREQGRFETYSVEDIASDTSFLEMLDILNDKLIREGGSPVAFDHDCREGICGMCSLYINGEAHGPDSLVTTCQLFMRRFKDGSTITVEPWRSPAFPIVKDLVVDRGAFDKIMQAGGYINVNTGGVPDANSIAVSQVNAELSMDAAACIGCGACVATCKNGSAMLFISARVSALSHLPQGKPDAARRVKAMIDEADKLGFGSCTNTRACEMECPKGIRISNIARLNWEWIKAKFQD
jgi:succinate dehydrogenase / fumarate reductase iron-sulfur subunit